MRHQAADEKGRAIGVDHDRRSIKHKVLCSMIKRVDVGTYTIVKSYADNAFGGKILELGVKEDWCRLQR